MNSCHGARKPYLNLKTITNLIYYSSSYRFIIHYIILHLRFLSHCFDFVGDLLLSYVFQKYGKKESGEPEVLGGQG